MSSCVIRTGCTDELRIAVCSTGYRRIKRQNHKQCRSSTVATRIVGDGQRNKVWHAGRIPSEYGERGGVPGEVPTILYRERHR